MPPVINGLGGGHTHTRMPTRGPKQFQETRHARPSAARAWFKNLYQTETNFEELQCKYKEEKSVFLKMKWLIFMQN